MRTRPLLMLAFIVLAPLRFVAGVASATTIPPQGAVGPHQYFHALVNGKNNQKNPVTIKMACFGAVRPGETGHPMAGQTVEVVRPVAILSTDGYTGTNATRIVASFGPQPTANPAATTVTLTRYTASKPIPTTLILPCAGTGRVTFTPAPSSKTARATTVKVSYVGQP